MSVFRDGPAKDVVQLPNEIINGVECLHYRVEHTRTMDTLLQRMEDAPDSNVRDSLENAIEMLQEIELTESSEIWIGKVDHIVRQRRHTREQTSDRDVELGSPSVTVPEGVRYKIDGTFTYSGFNEQVEIEAPVSLDP